jgi:hypothetical protein
MGMREVIAVRRLSFIVPSLLLIFSLAITSASAAAPGEQLWVARDGFTAPGARWSQAENAVSPDGKFVFVAGQYEAYENGRYVSHHIAVYAYRAIDGVREWRYFYDGPGGYGGPRDMAVDPSGTTVFVTGFSDHRDWTTGQSPTPVSDYVTVALDARTGEERWVDRYDGSGRAMDVAEGLAVTPNGRTVVVTGSSVGRGSGPDPVTIAYRAKDGMRLWTRRLAYPGHDGALDIALSATGRRAVVVGHRTTTGARDMLIAAFRVAGGRLLWTRTYAGSAGRNDEAVAVTVTGDPPTAYATGYVQRVATDNDIVTLAYGLGGTRRWAASYVGPIDGRRSRDRGIAIAARGDAGVVVTGSSVGVFPAKADFATIAYSPSGAVDWIARWAGTDRSKEFPADVAVSVNGTQVYVTGSAKVYAGEPDFMTVAYDAMTGAELWWARYDDVMDDTAQTVAVDPAGAYIVVTGGSHHETASGGARSYTTTLAYGT